MKRNTDDVPYPERRIKHYLYEVNCHGRIKRIKRIN